MCSRPPINAHRLADRPRHFEPQVHRIVYRTAGGTDGASTSTATPAPQSLASHYNVLDATTRAEIESIPSSGRFGSKLDFLTRHLLYIQRTSNTKTLVFSSFGRGLDFVAEALRMNEILFARLDGKGKKGAAAVETFRTDPRVNVFLLHSEAQSSGLNLLCATNIMLLEPLVNHALELQALGRVHRIGQTGRTSVFCYMVQDTVETRITELARHRGQSLYVKNEAFATHVVDSAVLAAQNAGRVKLDSNSLKGDFVSSSEELLACFFPEHVRATSAGAGAGADAHSASLTAQVSRLSEPRPGFGYHPCKDRTDVTARAAFNSFVIPNLLRPSNEQPSTSTSTSRTTSSTSTPSISTSTSTSTPATSTSTPAATDDPKTERERQREERIRAIERRQRLQQLESAPPLAPPASGSQIGPNGE